MPIRLVDRVTRLGRINAVLDGPTATLVGTASLPPGRTGIVAPLLQNAAFSGQGVFASAANRLGSISTFLNAASALLAGTSGGLISGSVTLTWTVPTLNDNGTPLTDLAGYTAYAGLVAGVPIYSVQINNPAATTFTWPHADFNPGETWFFWMVSRKTNGVESVITPFRSKTF